ILPIPLHDGRLWSERTNANSYPRKAPGRSHQPYGWREIPSQHTCASGAGGGKRARIGALWLAQRSYAAPSPPRAILRFCNPSVTLGVRLRSPAYVLSPIVPGSDNACSGEPSREETRNTYVLVAPI